MTTEQLQQNAATIDELRNVVIFQSAQLLASARENAALRSQAEHALTANKELVAEVQRLRGIFAEQEKQRADVGTVEVVEGSTTD